MNVLREALRPYGNLSKEWKPFNEVFGFAESPVVLDNVASTPLLEQYLEKMEDVSDYREIKQLLKEYMRLVFPTDTTVSTTIEGKTFEIKIVRRLIGESLKSFSSRYQNITTHDYGRRILLSIHNLIPLIERDIKNHWQGTVHKPESEKFLNHKNDQFVATSPYLIKDKKGNFQAILILIKRKDESPSTYYLKIEGTKIFEIEVERKGK